MTGTGTGKPSPDELPYIPPELPVGTVVDFAGAAAPALWLLCDGGQYARATYSELDAVLGTTYGAYTNGAGGAGTTHFRTPDLRGRVPIGLDNMGGTDAGRLAVANTRGASGGAETLAIASGNLPGHAHGISFVSGLENQNHNHRVDVWSGGGGGHSHTVAGGYPQPVIAVSIGSGSNQTHQLGFLNGAILEFTSIDAVGDHQHAINAESGWVQQNHNHNINGATDNGPGAGTALNKMPPYLLLNKIIYAGL